MKIKGRPCECGCGEPVNLAWSRDKARGIKKGDPRRFLQGHWSRTQEAREVFQRLAARRPEQEEGP